MDKACSAPVGSLHKAGGRFPGLGNANRHSRGPHAVVVVATRLRRGPRRCPRPNGSRRQHGPRPPAPLQPGAAVVAKCGGRPRGQRGRPSGHGSSPPVLTGGVHWGAPLVLNYWRCALGFTSCACLRCALGFFTATVLHALCLQEVCIRYATHPVRMGHAHWIYSRTIRDLMHYSPERRSWPPASGGSQAAQPWHRGTLSLAADAAQGPAAHQAAGPAASPPRQR